jgi:hypothetical protein
MQSINRRLGIEAVSDLDHSFWRMKLSQEFRDIQACTGMAAPLKKAGFSQENDQPARSRAVDPPPVNKAVGISFIGIPQDGTAHTIVTRSTL